MTLLELLKRYEQTRDELRGAGNPDASKYDELVAATREIVEQFRRAGSLIEGGEHA